MNDDDVVNDYNNNNNMTDFIRGRRRDYRVYAQEIVLGGQVSW